MAGTLLAGRRRHRRRYGALRQLGVDLARRDFEDRYPDGTLGPIVVVIPSYLEADNIADVVKQVPGAVDGQRVDTLVMIDGGDDGTEAIVDGLGARWAKLPTNLGQGVALRLGYELAATHGGRFVVTVDADGQNDPSELPGLVAPLLAGRSDFVIASRRLGVDETSDRTRRAGVVVFAAVVNRLLGQQLTDTSNGFRALRVEVLRDVVLEQDQYQTAELIISAASRGWRLSEVPTVWHPRASGESKKGHNILFGFRYAWVIARTWRRERG